MIHGEFPQSRLEDAIDRGFDPGERPEPAPSWVVLDEDWQAAVDAASHRASGGDDLCGLRCDICNEPMCALDGPEPATTCPAHRECVGCHQDNSCRACKTAGLRDFFDPWRTA